ncbi:MAG: outer membrane beta-barrel protein [Deltaproteobacteria bacterium]|jgi:opacity protein-like surface antigen|nr:outer membrane beta-barrel protein [Deltaproteobacteria bacterium]
MKNKLYLTIAAVIVFSSSINLANAEKNTSAVSVAPYVSSKISFGWVKAHNLSADVPLLAGTSFASSGHTDGVWGTKLAIGADTAIKAIHGSIRTELELGFNSAYENNGLVSNSSPSTWDYTNIESKTFLFNLYYDLNTCSKFTPYIGGGLGLSHLDSSVTAADPAAGWSFSSRKSVNKFSWQVGAGVAYALNDKVDLDLGYRYSDWGSLSSTLTGVIDIPIKADLRSHEVLLGLRYTF